MRELRGAQDGVGRRVAIVAARFNGSVTSKLVEGAILGLTSHGVDGQDIDLAWVPGAFEIPSVASRLAHSGRFDAVICLGAVVRGETAHFDLVAAEAARGVATASMRSGVPVIFEVLATEDMAQAEARAGGAHGNKGHEAALAALEMASLMQSLEVEEEHGS